MRKILFCLYFVVFLASLASAQDDEATANVKKILESNRCNWTFFYMPFQEVIDFICDTNKINIVVDPKVAKQFITYGIRVRLHVTDMKLKDALNLMLGMYNLCYTFRGGILLITGIDSEFKKVPAKMVFHDTSMFSLADQPLSIFARKLHDGIWLPYSLEEESQIRSNQSGTEDKNSHIPYISFTIPECIKCSIALHTWWSDENHSIQEIGNHGLMVIHTPDVQEQISLLLKELASFSTPLIPIEIWCFEVDNSILASSKLYCSPTVDEKTMSILEEATGTGKGHVVFHTKFNACNRTFVPLVNRDKPGRQCLIEILPILCPNKKVFIEMSSIISEGRDLQDTSSEKTVFQNFGSTFLLLSGKINTITISPTCDGRSLVTLMRVTPEQWEPIVKPMEEKASQDEENIRQKLRWQKMTLNFKAASLVDVISFMSSVIGINMLVDPEVYKELDDESLKVNFTCTDLSCECIINIQ